MRSHESLHDFCRAFESKNAARITTLFEAKGLCELPFIGQRLVGHREIREGFQRAFSVIDSCSIVPRSIKSDANATMAEGRLQARLYREPNLTEVALAVVMIEEAERIVRLSFYLDAARFRPWCDGPIFG